MMAWPLVQPPAQRVPKPDEEAADDEEDETAQGEQVVPAKIVRRHQTGEVR